ncbi:hypothetical protein [Paenibacillus sp. H1-7]|uniref:hypothetical protein n=1 Tax=Paenibacillus sp. H1-7 TaxID=2282849 RepID=UPI001EF8A1C1|nr:hypothetical protein [Paenibacillus sp. H1-7]
MEKNKLLEWLRTEAEKEGNLSENHHNEGYRLIHAGFEGAYKMLIEKIDAGDFDTTF